MAPYTGLHENFVDALVLNLKHTGLSEEFVIVTFDTKPSPCLEAFIRYQ
jgi:hypothetical protein